MNQELITKIKESNSLEKTKKITDFFDLLTYELENFKFHPKKLSLNSEVYDFAFNSAYRKLKEVNFQPFAIVGVLGSIILKKGHDIDIVFFPKVEISSGLFLAACSEFKKMIREKYEERYPNKITIFTFSTHQEESEYFSKRKENELFLHFVRICEGFYGKNIENKGGINTWMPKFVLFNDGKAIKDIKKGKFDRLLMTLDSLDLFEAGYPQELIKEKAHNLKYLTKLLKVTLPEELFNNPREAYQTIGILIDYFNLQ